MSNIEEKPLHEVVLDIMYFKDTEKPFSFSIEDVFWQIKDPNVSERQIEEVLGWLVVQKKAEKRFGKYQIDKYEFIDMSTKYSQENKESTKKDVKPITKVEVVKKVSIVKQKVSGENKSSGKLNLFTIGVISFTILLIISFSYASYVMYNTPVYSISKLELKEQELPKPSNLYVSLDKLNPKKKFLNHQFKDISYSFVKQNKMNKETVKGINKLNEEIIYLKKDLNKLNSSYKTQREDIKKVFLSLLSAIFLLLLFIYFIIYRKK